MNLKRISKVYVSPSVSFSTFLTELLKHIKQSSYCTKFLYHSKMTLNGSLLDVYGCDTLLENPWEGDFKILKISKQINPAPQKIGLRP